MTPRVPMVAALLASAWTSPTTAQEPFEEAATAVIRDLQEENPGTTYLLDHRSFRPGVPAEERTRPSEARHAERIRGLAERVGLALRDSAMDLREHEVALRLGDIALDGDGARMSVSFRGSGWTGWSVAILGRVDGGWSVRAWETHGISTPLVDARRPTGAADTRGADRRPPRATR